MKSIHEYISKILIGIIKNSLEVEIELDIDNINKHYIFYYKITKGYTDFIFKYDNINTNFLNKLTMKIEDYIVQDLELDQLQIVTDFNDTYNGIIGISINEYYVNKIKNKITIKKLNNLIGHE